MRRTSWTRGNRLALLENGEAYFPRVFDAIRGATREVIVETFILFDDVVGRQLRDVLVAAARRGARVDLLVDGYGSPDLSPAFIASLTDAGVRVRIFEPAKRLFGTRLNIFRRMHRKIVVVDGGVAFVGGINFSEDHLIGSGPMAKQDYAIECSGPVVAGIRRFVLHAIAASGGVRWFRRGSREERAIELPSTGGADAVFVTRDNWLHTTDIETHYLTAIRDARERVTIANAYFFPGYRFIRALRRAARRGVDVRLVLQGEPDLEWVRTAASLLYHHLVRAGVRVYEYRTRPLHAKIATIDDVWSTVGSSNLDPLSLSLNLEANVIVRDRAFNRELSDRMDALIRDECVEILGEQLVEWSAWRVVRSFFVFHFMRWYPKVASWFPRHAPFVRHERPRALRPDRATRTDTA